MKKIILTYIEDELSNIRQICESQLKIQEHKANEVTIPYVQIIDKLNEISDLIYESKIKV